MPPRSFEITVVRLSGESCTFVVTSHHCAKAFLQRVRTDMNVPLGRMGMKLVGDDVVLDPIRVGTSRPPFMERWAVDDYYVPGQRFPRVELRHYGIYNSCTLTLVVV